MGKLAAKRAASFPICFFSILFLLPLHKNCLGCLEALPLFFLVF